MLVADIVALHAGLNVVEEEQTVNAILGYADLISRFQLFLERNC